MSRESWLWRLVLVVLTFYCLMAQGQTAADGWIVENIHGPSQVGIVDTIPVDINKDGLMDVISVSIDDGHLRAYINHGNLEFEQQYISTDVSGAFRVSATDFNNDNEIDFLVPSIQTNEIIALIADPKAETYGYRKQIIAEGVLLPTDAQAGDFNNDGLIDVVSISFEENLLLLHLQNNSGEFDTTTLSELPQNPRKLITADFNNDQYLDILLASSGDNSVRLFSNDQSTTFTETLISDQLIGIRSIAKCDVPDLLYPGFVAGVTGADQLVLFSNNSNNTFNAKVIDDDLPGADSVSCADIDKDQELEIVSISRLLGNIYTHEIFGPLNKQLIANTRDGYVTAYTASFEKNEPPVILTQAFFEQRNLFYTLQLANQEVVIWEDFPDAVTKAVYADINRDGIEDVVVTSFKDDRVQWYDGVNNQQHVIAENIDGAADLVVEDFNQDGLVDVVSAASFANRFYWHKNLGAGQFETIVLHDNARFANSLTAVDLNSDGKIDVIGTSGTDDSVRWFDFSGEVVQSYLIDDTNDAPNDVVAGDIDGDGDIDLVVANYFSGSISHYLNDGNYSFEQRMITQGRNRPYAVLLYPAMKSALLNIVATISGDDEVWLYEQQQPNQFSEKLLSDELTNPRKLSYNQKLKHLYITSPDDQNILRIQNFPTNSQTESMVNQYLGASDVTQKTNVIGILGSSFNLNSIIKMNNNLIFSNDFEYQFSPN